MRNGIITLIGTLFTSHALALPCGHDGPTPFLSVISSPAVNPVAQLPGPAREMVLLERTNKVAYRDHRSQIHIMDLGTGKQKSFGMSLSKLLPFTDPHNQFLSTERPHRILDTGTLTSVLLPDYGTVRNATWYRGQLVRVNDYKHFHSRHLLVSASEPDGTTTLACQMAYPRHWVHVPGASYPKMIFREDGNRRFRLHEIDLAHCAITSSHPWTERLPGRVKTTHYFPQIPGVAAVIVQGSAPPIVRWQTRKSCRYMAPKKRSLEFFTHEAPIFLSNDSEMHLFGLESAKEVKLNIPQVTNMRLIELGMDDTLFILTPNGGRELLNQMAVDSIL